MSEVEALLRQYGYAFVFIGSFAEGETAVGLSGVAAHRGYLKLPLVVIVATMGAALGCQVWFHLGRARGRAFLDRRPHWHQGIQRFEALVKRWDVLVILSFRFLYGVRILGAAVLGVSKVPTWKFTVFNFAGALIWATVVATAGYFLGKAMEAVLGEVAAYEKWIFLGLLVIGLAVVGWKAWHRRRETT